MNNEEIKSLKPDKGVCRDCAGEMNEETKNAQCVSCRKNLFAYKGKIYECPLCEKFYCEEC